MASKRKAISVDEKVCVILAIEQGEKKSDVGRRFELSQSTVATIWKNKEAILQAALEGNSSKKIRKPKFEELDQAMLSWFNNQRQNNVPTSGPIVKAKAEKFAEQLGIIGFKASEGWLGKFKNRHHITYGERPLRPKNKDPFYKRVLGLIQPGLHDPLDNDALDTRIENQVEEVTNTLASPDMAHVKAEPPSPVSSPVPELSSSSLDFPHHKNHEDIESRDSERRQATCLHHINMQIKQEELKIKKEELKQSKIKTRLLLLELRFKKKECRS